MNANELADELESVLKAVGLTDNRVPTMLRQQQAEIEALKKLKADTDALDKKLFESVQRANEVWNKATKSILKKV
jgi:wyosine [tRNA(Phe)-imidazoG37] synthetase (radical SAM superfamily)